VKLFITWSAELYRTAGTFSGIFFNRNIDLFHLCNTK